MQRAKLMNIMIKYAGNIIKGVPGYTLERGKKLFWAFERITGVKFVDIYKKMITIDQSSSMMNKVVTNPIYQVRLVYSTILSQQITDEIQDMIDSWGEIFEDTHLESFEERIGNPEDELSFNLKAEFGFIYDDPD